MGHEGQFHYKVVGKKSEKKLGHKNVKVVKKRRRSKDTHKNNKKKNTSELCRLKKEIMSNIYNSV